MVSEWTSVTLADCGEWLSGGTPSKSRTDYWKGELPWVSPKDMNTLFIEDAQDHISYEAARNGSKIVPPGTILFVVRSMRLASEFQIALTRRDVAFNQDLKALRCYDFVDPLFLYYAVRGRSAEILGLVDEASHGTKRLRTEAIGALEIPIPRSKDEQREIAHILGALDDKIELNRRMNATLEAIARAIFKSWFVDFDPVHTKMRGEQPYGMDAETAALFPDSFEDSELGPIPAGWGVDPLDQIAKFQNGLALQKYPPRGDEYIPVIKIRELRQGYSDDNSDKASPNIREDCILYDGDIVFSWSGSLLVDIWCDGKAALNQHLFKVTSTTYPKWFYYYWTLYHLDGFQRIAADKATTMGHIKRGHLSAAMVAIPPRDLLERADEVIAPYLEAQITNRLQARTLAEIREALLPMLISGELRLAEHVARGI